MSESLPPEKISGDMEIMLFHKGLEEEFASVEVGGHNLIISEEDGDPHIYLADHATIRVEGEVNDKVEVVIGKGEYPTEITTLAGLDFYNRYDG